MQLFFHTLCLCSSLKFDFIPATGTPPPIRLFPFMDYLKPRESLIVFGGWDTSSYLNDLWEFSLKSSTWQKVTYLSSDIPGARLEFGGFTSQTEPKFYIFGGQSVLGSVNDFWEFSFETFMWQKIQTVSPPSPRRSFGFTSYADSGIKYFVIQGGTTPQGIVNDLFRLNSSSLVWEKFQPGGEAPLASFSPILEYYQGNILQTAGSPEGQAPCSPYLYSYSLASSTWSVISDRNSSFTCRIGLKSLIFEDQLIILFGWEYQTSTEASEIVKINLLDSQKQWQNLKVWPELSGDGFSVAKIEDSLYFFGGYLEMLKVNSNQLSKVDLKTLEYHEINSHFVQPQARSLHSMVVINSKLYVFGGIDSGQVFNDIWSFDLISEVWEPVLAKGQIPDARFFHSAGSDGDVFVVWGGETLNGLLDDLFIFNSITKQWSELRPLSNTKPSPAKGACLVLKDFKVYLYGGQRNSGKSNELWEYDIGTNLFKMLSKGIRSITFAFCWIQDNAFYVSLGSDEEEKSSPQIDFFNFSSTTWQVFHKHEFSKDDAALSSQVFLGKHLISIGGESWLLNIRPNIYAMGPGNLITRLESKLGFISYGAAFVYFKKFLYVFGGGSGYQYCLLPFVGNPLFAKFDIEDLCGTIGCQALCSPGTFVSGKNCLPCGMGSFSDEPGSLKCKKCKPGTYNNKTAASSRFQCIPCPKNTYSSESSASHCLPCLNSSFCPIGSSSPSNYEQLRISGSSQPSSYKEKNLSEDLLLYRVLVSLPIAIALFSCLAIKKLRKILIKFDLFDDKHDDDQSSFIIKKKTITGGIFSVFFMIGSLLITCTTVLIYFKDNIQETKGLVPLVILNSEVNSFESKSLLFQLSLSNYGGFCESNFECPSFIEPHLSNIVCSSSKTSCKLSDIQTCTIRIICKDGEIKTGAEVNFHLLETLSFTSGIEVNFTASSSIPDESSSVRSNLVPEPGFVFIGSTASEFYFLATPSLFLSEPKNWESEATGFHISEKNSPKHGSQQAPEDLPAFSNLNVKIFIETSPTALITKRVLKQDFIFFAGALLGTTSGLFGIAGFFMSFFENYYEKLVKKGEGKKIRSKVASVNQQGCEVIEFQNGVGNQVTGIKEDKTELENR